MLRRQRKHSRFGTRTPCASVVNGGLQLIFGFFVPWRPAGGFTGGAAARGAVVLSAGVPASAAAALAAGVALPESARLGGRGAAVRLEDAGGVVVAVPAVATASECPLTRAASDQSVPATSSAPATAAAHTSPLGASGRAATSSGGGGGWMCLDRPARAAPAQT